MEHPAAKYTKVHGGAVETEADPSKLRFFDRERGEAPGGSSQALDCLFSSCSQAVVGGSAAAPPPLVPPCARSLGRVSTRLPFLPPAGRVFLHPSSVNFSCGKFESGWLAYSEIVETSKVFVRESSMVPVYAVLLFGGEGPGGGRCLC